MVSSRSSKKAADPLSAVLAALDVRATRRAWLEAGGDWSYAFPALDRLKFVAALRGACWLVPDEGRAHRLSTGDVCLIGRTGYVVTSDPALPSADGLALQAHDDRLRTGGEDVLLLGGGVSFASGSSGFLLDLLPPILVVDGSSANAVATILALFDREAREPALGADAATTRLAELLIVEALRVHARASGIGREGWLGALADPRLGRALAAFHADVAHPWTVAMLATEAGMSRTAFSSMFTGRIGRPPLAYMRRWRLALARVRLAAGVPVGQVASEVGYQSQSAFGHAYRRESGASPGGRASKAGQVPIG